MRAEQAEAILGHPANAGVIRLLSRKGAGVSVVGPEAVGDPYYGCGSHPDVVERVWDQLGRGLSGARRRILCGTPVLVEPGSGLVLAVCWGTNYLLRVPEGDMEMALKAGCAVAHRWGDGGVTDLTVELGAGWVFGCWAAGEAEWCRAVGESVQRRR